MVLQRGPGSAVIWGYATEPGDLVTLNIDQEEYSTTATDGWYLIIQSSSPYEAVLKMKYRKHKRDNLHYSLVCSQLGEHSTIC